MPEMKTREELSSSLGSLETEIRERSPRLLEENFLRASTRIKEFATDTGLSTHALKLKTNKFEGFFDKNVFNNIVHTAYENFADSDGNTLLKSPNIIGRANASGQRDYEMGNTDYVFASADLLRSNSSRHKYEYEITSRNCFVVPMDIAHIKVELDQPWDKYQNKQLADLELDVKQMQIYVKNIYSYEDFKKLFSLYCSVVFDSPQQAIDFLSRNSFYADLADAYKPGTTPAWPEDQPYMEKLVELHNNYGILPPFSPEFQFEDTVEAKIRTKSEN